MPHILEASQHLEDDLILDGELFSPTMSLQDITSLCRSHQPQPGFLTIKLHVFDCINLSLPFHERIEVVISAIEELKRKVPNCPIALVPTTPCTKEHALSIYNSYLKAGYEGGIARDPNGIYQLGGRVTSVLKIKPFEVEPFKIIDIVDSEKRQREAILVFKAENGEPFKASLVGNRDYRTQIFLRKDQYIGRFALVKYPNESDKGTPVQAVVTEIY